MSYHITCDRCGQPINPRLAPEDGDSQDRIGLQLNDGSMENFDLHKGCADEFRTEFAAMVKRAKLHPRLHPER